MYAYIPPLYTSTITARRTLIGNPPEQHHLGLSIDNFQGGLTPPSRFVFHRDLLEGFHIGRDRIHKVTWLSRMIRSQQKAIGEAKVQVRSQSRNNGGLEKTVHGKEIFGYTSRGEGVEKSVGRGVEFGVATTKTGIQYWYDT